MDNISIPASNRTPEISFDFENHHMRISGESYPEDVTSFYNPLFAALDGYLSTLGNGTARFDRSLIYFNSSSAKAIMMLMERIDDAAAKGAAIDVYWYYDPEDETMHELGEEFGEDLQSAEFHLEQMPHP